MIIKSRGIVFRSLKYGESSLILDIYTEVRGLKSYIIGGVRKQKSKSKAGFLQVMSLLDIVAYDKEEGLNRIKEYKPTQVYLNIPFDMKKMAVGQFMIELARKTIREKEENRTMFEFLFDYFSFLDQTNHSPANLHLQFMTDLSGFLGFLPSMNYDAKNCFFNLKDGFFTSTAEQYTIDKELSHLLFQSMTSDKSDSHNLPLTRESRTRLVESMLQYYKLHIENLSAIQSHIVLKEVLD